eukprot:GHVU01175910.1.p6 GENE.GHVU01175910.1~~GHVU01175910.1.p6  ORF type:complete len:118 (-),score=14.97 GHVU01175910.1:800-1153(-)
MDSVWLQRVRHLPPIFLPSSISFFRHSTFYSLPFSSSSIHPSILLFPSPLCICGSTYARRQAHAYAHIQTHVGTRTQPTTLVVVSAAAAAAAAAAFLTQSVSQSAADNESDSSPERR